MTDLQFKAWMERLGASTPATPGQGSDAIWWKAELRRRLAVQERAVRPIRIAERLVWASCLIGAVVLIAGMR